MTPSYRLKGNMSSCRATVPKVSRRELLITGGDNTSLRAVPVCSFELSLGHNVPIR